MTPTANEPPPGGVAATLAAVAGTGVLAWFGHDLRPWWPLMWFAPLPVLVFAAGSRAWWRAGLVAFAAWFVGGGCLWVYFRTLGVPFAGWAAMNGAIALVFAAAVLLFRALVRRGCPWSALVALPAAWTTCEFAVSG